jgi:signal peptidase I
LIRRAAVWVAVVAALLGLTLFILDRTWLLVSIGPGGSSSAPTIDPCDNRALAEGFTYKFRDPRRGEVVLVRTTGVLGGTITPDPDGDLPLAKRVAGIPGDQVLARNGRVYVNGLKFDDITTARFARVDLGTDEYFLLGDNRSFSQDSRDFGPVPREAIVGRVFFIYWPLGDFGGLPSRKPGAPPGQVSCD